MVGNAAVCYPRDGMTSCNIPTAMGLIAERMVIYSLGWQPAYSRKKRKRAAKKIYLGR